MPWRATFTRVLLGVHPSGPDPAAIEFAARFAQALRLEIRAVIIEEPHVAGLSGLPQAREFRLLSRSWQPFDREGFARDLAFAEVSVRRRLTAAAALHRVSCEFETVKASARQALRELSRPGDIILIPEPKAAIDRIVGPFPQLTAAALHSEAAVLFVPARGGRTNGPVVAVAANADDPSIGTALAIAAGGGDSAIVLVAEEKAEALAQSLGPDRALLREVVSVPRSALGNADMLASILGARRERLIVMTRNAGSPADETAGSVLSARRRVPVLLLEPQPAPDAR